MRRPNKGNGTDVAPSSELPVREALGTKSPQLGKKKHTRSPLLHKVSADPYSQVPRGHATHLLTHRTSPVFKGHLATTRHESLCRMNSQATSITRSWAQTQISYFLKSLLCSLLFKSDSISLFRVSFSLRSWKSREQEREDVDYGKKSAVTRTPAAPSLHQHQRGAGGRDRGHSGGSAQKMKTEESPQPVRRGKPWHQSFRDTSLLNIQTSSPQTSLQRVRRQKRL